MLVLCAVSVFWIGLRRGWWVDLVTLFLKAINNKGSPRKPKPKAKRESLDDAAAEDDAEADAEAGQAAGSSKAAKALFEAMKAKMRGTGAERKQWILC